jgi:D-alanyl-D-alanine carboxypeptidase/D-alanyl-D-alanine-endopeptidase (penicillin-binding protein 4)
VKVERRPSTDYVSVDSRTLTCHPADTPGLTLDRPLGGNKILLGGCLPPGSGTIDRWVAVEDPALYATHVFAEALRAKGIDVGPGVATAPAPPADAQVLATYEGAPLAEILKDVNKPSHNLRAEMLLRQIGVKTKGEGSVAAGREGVFAFLHANGIDAEGWEIADGSGLSALDLVTARGLTMLLLAMHRHPHAAVFRDSLPVAGVDGTLKHRLGLAGRDGRIVAKTGTNGHTYALAGYARPRRGPALAFTVIVNHSTAPTSEAYEVVDAIAASLVE